MSVTYRDRDASDNDLVRYIKFGALGVAALIVVGTAFGSFYTVGPGERGVVLRFGKVTGTAQPGLNWKMPWAESVHFISTQTHLATYDKMNSYSQDSQPADMKVSVNYHVDPARVIDVYTRFGSVENAVSRVISPAVNRDVKIAPDL